MNTAAETRPCAWCGASPARRFLNGPLCVACGPAQVTPPAGTTLVDLVARSGMAGTLSSSTVVDDRAIASGKRRSHPNAYRAATAPEQVTPAQSPAPAPDSLAAANVARVLGAAGRAPRTVSDPYVRDGHTATSFAAAVKALPKSGSQRRMVLEAIVDAYTRGHAGATDPELIRHLALSGNSVRPRRGELVEMGLAVDSGRTRQHDGNAHTIWGPTAAALAALHITPAT